MLTFHGKRIGVTIPAYNEEVLIPAVLRNMPHFVDRIYLVNDGSTDGTRHLVGQLCRTEHRLTLIDHAVNMGVGAAIVSGYKRCLEEGMDVAVVMAGDDQMDPGELPRLLEPLLEGRAGYSKGNRMSTSSHVRPMPVWRRFGNWLLKWATRVSSGNFEVMDPQNGYTAASADALQRIDLETIYPRYGYCNHILAKLAVAGIRTVEVPMAARYQGEKSKIRYATYIPSVSWLLLKLLLWRMRMRLAVRREPEREGDSRASR